MKNITKGLITLMLRDEFTVDGDFNGCKRSNDDSQGIL